MNARTGRGGVEDVGFEVGFVWGLSTVLRNVFGCGEGFEGGGMVGAVVVSNQG